MPTAVLFFAIARKLLLQDNVMQVFYRASVLLMLVALIL